MLAGVHEVGQLRAAGRSRVGHHAMACNHVERELDGPTE
jgi:hypothetical protein